MRGECGVKKMAKMYATAVFNTQVQLDANPAGLRDTSIPTNLKSGRPWPLLGLSLPGGDH